MPKPDFMTPKAIANRIKAKGLQKLRWYCQMCQKQCRDENGFKCHMMSESHQRQMLLFQDSPSKFIGSYSDQFKSDFLRLLKHRFGENRVYANVVYNEYIRDRNHVHMNATCWSSLAGFVKTLGRLGICRVDETPKGWYMAYIDRDPAVIARQEASRRKDQMMIDDADRAERALQEQIQKGLEAAANQESNTLTDEEARRIFEAQYGPAATYKISLSFGPKAKSKDTQSSEPSAEANVEEQQQDKEDKEDKEDKNGNEEEDNEDEAGEGDEDDDAEFDESELLEESGEGGGEGEEGEGVESCQPKCEQQQKTEDQPNVPAQLPSEVSVTSSPSPSSIEPQKKQQKSESSNQLPHVAATAADSKNTTKGAVSVVSCPELTNMITAITKSSQDKIPEKEKEKKKRRTDDLLESLVEEQETHKRTALHQKYSATVPRRGTEAWVTTGILVKVLSNVSAGKYYKKKGVVQRVIDTYVGEVKMSDSDALLRVDQEDMETVIPSIGKRVLILRGPYRGQEAELQSLDVDKFCCTVVLVRRELKGQVVRGIAYEDLCKLNA